MNDLLHNPVYNALLTGDSALGFGTGKVKCFDAQVSPFIGFEQDYAHGFSDLLTLLPGNRRILYANPEPMTPPDNWQVVAHIAGIQFIFDKSTVPSGISLQPVALNKTHVPAMMELATLTKPGPFNERTIEFGNYHGIFAEDKLVAMAGERMHVADCTEISAVCTHPGHLGKGYAAALLSQQLDIIISNRQTPFLHVRADNARAVELYERLGFKLSRPMNFYFMKRK